MQYSGNGALSAQQIKALIHTGGILSEREFDINQVQPASIDLRLGEVAFRVRASFLPGKDRSVAECLEQQLLHKIDLTQGAVLEKSCVYIIPLLESVNLPITLGANANPKSSTGRIDVLTRLIFDGANEFERVECGYKGKLYLEVAPLTFSVLVRTGSRLSQLRLRVGESQLDDEAHWRLQQQHTLVDSDLSAQDMRKGVPLSVDLSAKEGCPVGYRAKRHSGIIDVDKVAALPMRDFWEPIFSHRKGLVLDPGEFYILVSKENVTIPAFYAAEMAAYDNFVGEFRVHYAGFFDPGFGLLSTKNKGAKAVLEVRSFDVPFLIEDGQNVGRLVYEAMLEKPEKLYGETEGLNHYQSQSLQLSKHFYL